VIKFRYLAALLILGLLCSLGLACSQEAKTSAPVHTGNKPIVAVSVVPEQGFIEAIAKDLVEVVVMIPPGYNPENYAPTPQEMAQLSKASLYFAIGVPTEKANILPYLKDLNPGIKVVDLAEEVAAVYPDLYFAPGERDPHIWLSPSRAQVIVDTMADELALLDPNNADYYRSNAESYGEKVKEGQVLISLDSSDYEAGIRQAEAALEMAQAAKRANDVNKATAKANYERTLMLHEGGAVSDSQLEAAKAQYDALNSGSAEAAVQQAQAALQQALDNIGNCTIKAPISGVVGSIALSLGEMANLQSPAAIISDTSQLEVEIQVSESEISYVQEGSEVEVMISAVSPDPFKGVVASVSVAADPASKNYKVKITMDNPEGQIKSGMFAQVFLSTVSESNALCVPRNAVIPKGSQSVVYIVDEESRARMQVVETGIENSKYIQISKGLKEGQEVIEKGNTLVSDGSKVRVVTGGEK
jgi:RND family efflux transporter MFP subunit